MIIEFLTKKVPFPNLTDVQVMFAITSNGLTPTLNENWDNELCEKLKSCWNINSFQRPTMEDLLIFFESKLDQFNNGKN